MFIVIPIVVLVLISVLLGNIIMFSCVGASFAFILSIIFWFAPRRNKTCIIFSILCCISGIDFTFYSRSIVVSQGCFLLTMIAAIIFAGKALADWPQKGVKIIKL